MRHARAVRWRTGGPGRYRPVICAALSRVLIMVAIERIFSKVFPVPLAFYAGVFTGLAMAVLAIVFMS
jgi:hypothetical protein